ncbi:THP3 homolog C2A9.11c [Cyclospora cayetanensis]|nr:THP3 homolog C2A9.11c [Cyclospora cayetanensis]
MSWEEKLELAKSTERIVGRNLAIEKPYLRLTNAPDPATVRPEHVLHKTLAFLLDVAAAGEDKSGGSCSKGWVYLDEQFRSLRQDLTVQHICNSFTREVYEQNARLALRHRDLGQFNQCQAQLRHLYVCLRVPLDDPQRLEFLCYRLVYMALQGMRLDLLRLYREMAVQERQSPQVQQCRLLGASLLHGNWRRFFRMLGEAPFCVEDLCELFRPKVQMQALVALCRVSPTATVASLQRTLMFPSARDCLDFLEEQKAVFQPRHSRHQQQSAAERLGALVLDCKASLPNFEASPLLKKKVHAMG